MLALALSYATSAVVIFFRDLTQIINIFLQVGVWLTPIMWQVEQFSGSSFYPILCKLVKFNPMYYVVVGYRDSMIMGNGFWQRPGLTLYFWAVTLITMLVGLKVFKRLRPHFSDVL